MKPTHLKPVSSDPGRAESIATGRCSSSNSVNYVLSSPLARLSLPQEYKDTNRRLAWVNSICLAFLLIGLVGLKVPKVHVKPLPEVVDAVPVVITPPEELPKPVTTERPPKEEQQPEDVAPDTPIVATPVAATPAAAAFAVPVQGPVILSPIRFAAPPPRNLRPPAAAAEPTKYVPSVADWGPHPLPQYPPLALRMGYQGKVVLLITVDPSGIVTSVEVKNSSGYKILDEAALEHVRAHLRLRNPPGEVRHHTLDILFQIR